MCRSRAGKLPADLSYGIYIYAFPIQQVLAACKEFNVPCGYPAGAADIEMRMKQGFSVFVIGWGEPGFKAVEIGRGVSGR